MTIRVFVADDHPLVREGLHRILQNAPAIRVVGEADDGVDLLTRLETTGVDVLLLDISMPGPGFLQLMAQIRSRYPALKILVVSMHPEAHYAARALQAGATGYVSKRQSVEELTRAIAKVQAGGIYVSGPLAQAGAGWHTPVEQLSGREFEILKLLAEGRGTTQIAAGLGLSPKTVSTYRVRLLKKLGLGTNADLVRFAIENQLIA